MKKLTLLIAGAFFLLNASSQQLEIPLTPHDSPVITHSAYSLQYSEDNEQAYWVAYELTKEETNSIYERTNKFMYDPNVSTGTAIDSDYKGYGYDRGHLAPAGDMGWSSIAMKESFYYSNISPQLAGFNRGVWKRLESLVRSWAFENESIYVVTGPILTDDGLGSIGTGVTVPKRFYKVILDYQEPNIKAIAFVLRNESSKAELSSFAVSIDYLESITGFDFFSTLPDSVENQLEANVCTSCWSWKAYTPSSSSKSKTSSSVQCSGVTQKGLRCKNNTLNESGYCHHHFSQSKEGKSWLKSTTKSTPSKKSNYNSGSSSSTRCTGTTQKGARCKRMTKASNGRCYQH